MKSSKKVLLENGCLLVCAQLCTWTSTRRLKSTLTKTITMLTNKIQAVRSSTSDQYTF